MSWKRKLKKFLERTRGGLIVSCQSERGSPFHSTKFMVAYAMAAEMAGASGIRTNGTRYIKAIKKAIDLPIIGIYKKHYPGFEVYITPTKREAALIARAGADIIGIDATMRSRPLRTRLDDLIGFIKYELGLPVLADISTVKEAVNAEKLGADVIATTLSGYTSYTREKADKGPDIELVRELSQRLNAPIIAEGRYWSPEEVCSALRAGAHAVVVGTAITRPHKIIERYVKAIKQLGMRT